MESLLTPEDVKDLLKISKRTVYDHARRWGGFYPGGTRKLRFHPMVIYGIMEGQDPKAPYCRLKYLKYLILLLPMCAV